MAKPLLQNAPKLACLFGLLALGRVAHADDGFYFQAFDPVQQSQIDGALAGLEKFGLDRVLLIPDPRAQGGASLETRWRMLRAAAAEDHRLVVPPLEEVRGLAGLRELRPLRGKFRVIADGHKVRPPLAPELRGADISLVAKRERLEGRRNYVRVLNSPAQDDLIRANPAMAESLLPEPVARIVREEKLYGHSGLRGYYGLPRALTKQIDFEQRLNDRIENKSVFASLARSDLPLKYYPEERPTFPVFNVDVPAERVEALLTGAPPPNILVEKSGKKFVRFFIHPQSAKLFRKKLAAYPWHQDFWATPTSSHRSLIVWNPRTSDPPFGVKTTLDATMAIRFAT